MKKQWFARLTAFGKMQNKESAKFAVKFGLLRKVAEKMSAKLPKHSVEWNEARTCCGVQLLNAEYRKN
jgi:hypothetical protein